MKKYYKRLDCLGVIKLKMSEIAGIEFLVTKYKNYCLSRNNLYYNVTTLESISKTRANLYNILSHNKIKNYVILDYIIHYSSQAYYYLLSQFEDVKLIEECKNALEEDVKNFIHLIENKEFIKPNFIIPNIDKEINVRNIEMDNKLLVYAFVKSFDKPNYTLVHPGLGSILIGSFFKIIHNANYQNIIFSRYRGLNNLDNFKIINQKLNNEIYLIDDNIGSGLTTEELLTALSLNHIVHGATAIEFDWFIYDKVSQNRSPYKKFNYTIYEKLSFLNTRNHRFLDSLVLSLKENPMQYNKILNKNNFNHIFKSDIKVQYAMGKKIAKKYLPFNIYKSNLNFTRKILKNYMGIKI